MDADFFEKVKARSSSAPDEKMPAVLFLEHDVSDLPQRPDPDLLKRMSGKKFESTLKSFRKQVKNEVVEIQKPILSYLRSNGFTDFSPSEGIPVIYASMTPQEILDIGQKRDLFSRVRDGEKVPIGNGGETCKNPMPVAEEDLNHCAIGLPNVHDFSSSYLPRAAIIEWDGLAEEFSQCGMNIGFTASINPSNNDAHATQVASVLSSNHGVFPDARVDSFHIDQTVDMSFLDPGYESAINWGLDNGVYIFNASLGSKTTGHLFTQDHIIDSLIYKYGPTFAVSAGNIGKTCSADTPYVSSPGTAYNVITVGSFYRGVDNGCNISNDTLSSHSCYKDPHPVGRQKPEVLAQGTCMPVTDYPQSSSNNCNWLLTTGTSIASPQVAGGALVLAGVDPPLLSWTEGVKALFMATAFNTANLGYGLTEGGGAGGIRLDNAYESVEAGRWQKMPLSGCSDYTLVTWQKNITVPAGTERAKFAIAWSINDPDWLEDWDLLVTGLYLYSGDQLIAVAENPYNANNFVLLDVNLPIANHPQEYTLYAPLIVAYEELEASPMAFAWGINPICLEKGQNFDNDNYCTNEDNCPSVSNSGQENIDSDAKGDACDPCDDRFDQDGDGDADNCDNCPTVKNADQANLDDDAFGDACDPDIDNDGCLNGEDLDDDNRLEKAGWYLAPFCSTVSGFTYAFAGKDSDNDGILNCAEKDNDQDGVDDVHDLCPDIPGENDMDCMSVKSCPLVPIFRFDPTIVEEDPSWWVSYDPYWAFNYWTLMTAFSLDDHMNLGSLGTEGE